MSSIYLGVNIDHVATLRNARGTQYPDPVHAAEIAERAGADGITIHLREDRRHITDRDVRILRETLQTRMNLEMAVTDEMVEIALQTQPEYVCLVPEKREELTTEGGLDVLGQLERVKAATENSLRLALKFLCLSMPIVSKLMRPKPVAHLLLSCILGTTPMRKAMSISKMS